MDLVLLGMVVEAVALVVLAITPAAVHQAAALLGLAVLELKTIIKMAKLKGTQVVEAVVLGELLQIQAMQAALVVVAVELMKTITELTVLQTQAVVVEAVAPETHLPMVVTVVQELW